MALGLIQTLPVRLPLTYYINVQPSKPDQPRFSAPITAIVGIILNVIYYIKLRKQLENAAKYALSLKYPNPTKALKRQHTKIRPSFHAELKDGFIFIPELP